MGFVLAAVKNATKLQVLVMYDENRPNEASVSLNNFCSELSSSPFLTSLRFLQISSHHETNENDAGFVVSQHNLEEFLLKFFSAPSSHPQTIELNRITVQDFTELYNVAGATQPVPFWHRLEASDRHYLYLKTVKFEYSRFTRSRVTPWQISNWVGEEVCEDEYGESTSFVIQGSRKRPFSEWKCWKTEVGKWYWVVFYCAYTYVNYPRLPSVSSIIIYWTYSPCNQSCWSCQICEWSSTCTIRISYGDKNH